MALKIILIGATGQLGRALRLSLASAGVVIPLSRDQLDLTKLETLSGILTKIEPDVIVNAAAYTKVDEAECNLRLTRLINFEAVKIIADYAFHKNILLIHYSTDYVFDGLKTKAYTESDAENPLNVYGETKQQADQAIRNSGCRHLIFRISWVYSEYKTNFLDKIIQLLMTRQTLEVVNDQNGSPTNVHMIAAVTAECINKYVTFSQSERDRFQGLYNLSSDGQVSRYEFAKFIQKELKVFSDWSFVENRLIIPVSSEYFETAAKRPNYSVLNCKKIKKNFGISLANWEIQAAKYVRGVPLRKNDET
ncbi:MAG: dTDP-4-dehydrorhamnose reductase [Paracoccaceae bacterium]